MITGIHHPPAGRAIPIEAIQFPGREIRILGPGIRHCADLPVVARSIDVTTQQEITPGTPIF
jgi:hypothetical protein